MTRHPTPPDLSVGLVFLVIVPLFILPRPWFWFAFTFSVLVVAGLVVLEVQYRVRYRRSFEAEKAWWAAYREKFPNR